MGVRDEFRFFKSKIAKEEWSRHYVEKQRVEFNVIPNNLQDSKQQKTPEPHNEKPKLKL